MKNLRKLLWFLNSLFVSVSVVKPLSLETISSSLPASLPPVELPPLPYCPFVVPLPRTLVIAEHMESIWGPRVHRYLSPPAVLSALPSPPLEADCSWLPSQYL